MEETVYHYCSANAFLSIINQGKIRLSNSMFSNDYKEGKILLECIQKYAEEKKITPETQEHFRLKTIISEMRDIALHNHVVCFSDIPDLLSQWRGYGDECNGFSIGFSTKYLKQSESNQKKFQSHYSHVNYIGKQHDFNNTELYSYVDTFIKKRFPRQNKQIGNFVNDSLLNKLEHSSATFKQRGFKEENESSSLSDLLF
ncbi:MAG: DUF2971 domain-containing protein [Marinilabiliaceae bacterium]|nr:DUF2971 domain-containing protein [Marinilabiliaceae bacterium]